MPVMTDVARSVPLNGVAKGVFALQLHEYVQVPGIVNVYCSAAAAGVLVTINIGNVVLIQDQEVSSSNRFPIRPDDLLLGAVVVRPGDRIVVDFRNRTAGNINVTTLVDILPA